MVKNISVSDAWRKMAGLCPVFSFYALDSSRIAEKRSLHKHTGGFMLSWGSLC